MSNQLEYPSEINNTDPQKYERQRRQAEREVMEAMAIKKKEPKKIRWPRGKHNGRKIGGFSIKIKVNVLYWFWKPVIRVKHAKYFHWLCFSIFINPVYGD